MEFFPLASKKASVTLVFLIVSILVVSSGAVIVHEVKKNNDEITGTGLVLLDKVQHVGEEQVDNFEDEAVDNVNSFVVYDKKNKESSKSLSRSSRSKKSSSSSSSSSSKNLSITNLSLENNDLDNEGNSSDNTKKSEGEIFSRNGTKYIMRDGKEYKLASSDSKYKSKSASSDSKSAEEIKFSPALPSSVCENEKIDITVKGKAKFSANYDQQLDCALENPVKAYYKLCIYESDPFTPDDLVQCTPFQYASAYSSDCLNPYYFYFEYTFTSIDLSDEIIPDAGGNGEFYAIIKQNPYIDNAGSVYPQSTSNYDVYGYVQGECKCSSGACCDLRSRPYIYKSHGSQPTGKTDYYFCSGTNSPTGTSYVKKRDYYCSGTSPSYTWSDSIKNTCGTCAYCKHGDGSCHAYHSNEYCGTKDCDYLDVTCRNYHDVNRGCSFSGDCSNPSCNSYTNAQSGTSCGTNRKCDGNGNCVSVACTNECSAGQTGCTNSYTHWDCQKQADGCYDKISYSCGISSCPSDYYKITGTQSATSPSYCYKYDYPSSCSKTCSDGSCKSCSCSATPIKRNTAGTCKYISGCSGSTSGTVKNYAKGTSCGTNKKCDGSGNCVTVNIVCSSNSGCGTNTWTGSSTCTSNDVWQSYKIYTCHNAGTTSSYCSNSTSNKKKTECGEDYCEDWEDNYCSEDDVYHSKTCYDKGCSGGACFDRTSSNKQKVQDCGTAGCSNGKCNIVCSSNSDCGTDTWVSSAFCSGDNVWQSYKIYTCHNAGTTSSYCSNSTSNKKKTECGTSGYSGSNYCYDSDVYKNYINKGCSSGSCYSNTEKKKQEECGSDSCGSWGTSYCKGEDVYRKRTCYDKGCSGSSCFDNAYIEEQKVKDCEEEYGGTCDGGRCKICSLTRCYYY